MSFIKIWVHAVWATKKRTPFLSKELRKKLITHIIDNANAKGIYIDRLNGYVDHMHCLISLPAKLSISQVMQLIKGESSYWININKLVNGKFEWADDYYASAISESYLNRVRAYIDFQEAHHSKLSFQKECDNFLKSIDLSG